MLNLTRSNRVEALADALAELMRTPAPSADGVAHGGDPMASETVVVSSRGMERWLSMALARRLGICANVRFPFPARALHQALAALEPDHAVATEAWSPSRLTFAIASRLDLWLTDPAFQPLADYLAREPETDALGPRRLALAARLADVVDRYVTYRPRWVLDLLAPRPSRAADPHAGDWQALMLRDLRGSLGVPTLAERARDIARRLATPEGPDLVARADPAMLPPRMVLFGVSTLAPFYVELLRMLAVFRDVHLFVLVPSRAYWAHVRSRREQARLLRAQRRGLRFEGPTPPPFDEDAPPPDLFDEDAPPPGLFDEDAPPPGLFGDDAPPPGLFGDLPPLTPPEAGDPSPDLDVPPWLLEAPPIEAAGPRDTAGLDRAGGEGQADALHFDEGHPVLAAFGKLGRDFQLTLEGLDGEPPYLEPFGERFVSPVDDGAGGAAPAGPVAGDLFAAAPTPPPADPLVLHQLQRDLLELDAEAAPEATAPPRAVAPGDRSVRVHACHGPRRQIEVLREELWRALAADPTLEPRDIVVMTPDVEAIAPLVQAVFEDAPDPERHPGAPPRLPVAIADRGLGQTHGAADVLMRCLALAGGRLPASEVLALLEHPRVAARFDLSPGVLAQARTWLGQAGARWGRDARHREAHGQPADATYTWRFALDRLLIGHAVLADTPRSVGGVVPWDELEGHAARDFGRVADALSSVFDAVRLLERPRTVPGWAAALGRVLDLLIARERDDDAALEAAEIRQALEALARDAAPLHDRPIRREALVPLLEGRFAEPPRATGYLTGAVTVCALVPLRNVPFRVVALVGLDDGVFPRKAPQLGFDRTLAHPEPGDRSPRDEDRWLLLEALLAARDQLIVTFTGRSPDDDEPRPPAVPLQELIDALEDRFAFPAEAPLRVEHPLQPWSPRAFRADAPASHDPRMLAAAQLAAQAVVSPEPAPPFLAEPLPEPAPEQGLSGAGAELEIDVDELVALLSDPAKHFLASRLELRLVDADGDAVDDREPAGVAGLAKWQVRDGVLQELARDPAVSPAVLADRLRGRGLLPLGGAGEAELGERLPEMRVVAQAARDEGAFDEGARRPAAVDVALGEGVRLVGSVEAGPEGLCEVQAGSVKAKHRLALAVRHVALHLSDRKAPRDGWRSVLVGVGSGKPKKLLKVEGRLSRAERVELGPMDRGRAMDLARELVAWWRWAQRQPLPGGPETWRAWHGAGEDVAKQQEAAEKAWASSDGHKGPPGEGEGVWARRVWGDARPFGDGDGGGVFEGLAEWLWGELAGDGSPEEGR